MTYEYLTCWINVELVFFARENKLMRKVRWIKESIRNTIPNSLFHYISINQEMGIITEFVNFILTKAFQAIIFWNLVLCFAIFCSYCSIHGKRQMASTYLRASCQIDDKRCLIVSLTSSQDQSLPPSLANRVNICFEWKQQFFSFFFALHFEL